mgnify:FL=1
MPMSREDLIVMDESIAKTTLWFVCVPLLIIIFLLIIIAFKI